MKKQNITYEELMSSHFMRFPAHSRIVHIIFNPLLCGCILMVLTVLCAKIVGTDWSISIISGVFAAYALIRQYQAQMNLKGHGVGLIKKGKFSVLGLPQGMSIASIFFGLVIITMFTGSFLGDFNSDKTSLNFKTLSSALLASHILSLLSWRLHTYYETWYGDEYKARIEFKNRGLSDHKIEEYIVLLRRKGILE